MAILEIKDVSHCYSGAGKPALEGISLKLESGQHAALIGANGSGKSTLAKIAAGLLQPTSGDVVLIGAGEFTGWHGIGLLLQNPDEQFLSSDVESEIAWGLENLALPPDEMQRRVEEVLERFELADKKEFSPETLSDGWKQITNLAATVAMQPQFLILDEVTAFLDPYWTAKVRAMAAELTESSGLLWVTSNTREVLSADRIFLLHEGRLIEEGTPDEILRKGHHNLLGMGLEPVPEWMWDEVSR